MLFLKHLREVTLIDLQIALENPKNLNIAILLSIYDKYK